jgi:invasion protein IalB
MPPWGVLIRAGLAVRIDGQPPLQLTIASCLASGCLAESLLGDGMLQALRSGAGMQIVVISAEGKPIVTSVPMAGFSEAYARIAGKRAP